MIEHFGGMWWTRTPRSLLLSVNSNAHRRGGAGRAGRAGRQKIDEVRKRAGICDERAWRSLESNPRTVCLITVHRRPQSRVQPILLACIGSGECGSKDVIHLNLGASGNRHVAYGAQKRELDLLGRQRSLPPMPGKPGSSAQLSSCSHALPLRCWHGRPVRIFSMCCTLAWLAARAELFPYALPYAACAEKRSPDQQLC